MGEWLYTASSWDVLGCTSPPTLRFPSAPRYVPWASGNLGMYNPIHPSSQQCTYTLPGNMGSVRGGSHTHTPPPSTEVLFPSVHSQYMSTQHIHKKESPGNQNTHSSLTMLSDIRPTHPPHILGMSRGYIGWGVLLYSLAGEKRI